LLGLLRWHLPSSGRSPRWPLAKLVNRNCLGVETIAVRSVGVRETFMLLRARLDGALAVAKEQLRQQLGVALG
jgi:hypothetical protein